MSWKYVQRDTETGQYRTTDQGGGGGGSSTFAGLDDVSFSGLQNGQIPKYNSQTQKWENANESGGGGTVTDVEVNGTSVVNQQGVAEITIPTPPSVPVQDVEVDGVSVVDGQGTAEITIPVKDVKVNGTSVVSNKEAQIKSYKEVTLAEYQALPSSKLSDDIMYCIKDAGGSGGVTALADLDDVDIDNPSNGDLLKYNANTLKWEKYTPTTATTHKVYETTFSWKRGSSSSTADSLSYTAPSDGWVFAWCYMANTNFSYCAIEGAIYDDVLQAYVICDTDADTSDYHTWRVTFPVKKGDQIKIKTRLDSGTLPSDAKFRFFG